MSQLKVSYIKGLVTKNLPKESCFYQVTGHEATGVSDREVKISSVKHILTIRNRK